MAKNKDKQDKQFEGENAANVQGSPDKNGIPADANGNITEDITLTAEEFAKVKAHIDGLQKDLESTVDMAQRLQADFDNYRKRNATISSESRDEGMRIVTKALLPVIDNFDRAMISFVERGCPDPSWYDGVKLVYKQLMDALAKEGLEEIDTECKFDPLLHEAVLQEKVDGVESGTIISVLQKGYRLKDRIIRHSLVKVAQ